MKNQAAICLLMITFFSIFESPSWAGSSHPFKPLIPLVKMRLSTDCGIGYTNWTVYWEKINPYVSTWQTASVSSVGEVMIPDVPNIGSRVFAHPNNCQWKDPNAWCSSGQGNFGANNTIEVTCIH